MSQDRQEQDTPPPTSGILLGYQQQTCLWRKRVVSFFTNRRMSNCLVHCDSFFAASLDIHMVSSVALRQGSTPSATIWQFSLVDGHTRTTPSSEIPAPASADVARTKVFVYPLFSHGRMYKYVEHLKRHVRSHTGTAIPVSPMQQEVLSIGQPQPASPHSHEDGRRGCDRHDCELRGCRWRR